MIIESLVFIHILSGAIGLLTGFLIILLAKGTNLHKRIGKSFFYAIMVLGLTGAIVGFSRWIPLSALNGLLVCYFVLTSLLVIQKEKPLTLKFERILALFGGVLVVSYILFAFEAGNMPEGELGGFGSTSYLVFGAITAFAVVNDAHYLLKQQQSVRARIIRHLWRMLFPLFMAAAAFFLGQAKLFPPSIQQSLIIFVPVFIAVGAMLSWNQDQ
jgi:uncharacterized membrane protein